VDIARRPEDVFPWLLDEDKVPQWTGDLQRYEVSGPLGTGARVKQVLDVAGGLTLDLELTRYDPPRGAASTFSTNGVNVVTTYELEPTATGTRLTQTLDAKASGLTARMLIPVVQGRLEKKVVDDLGRLRGVLGG
jgi:uncharacterized protein YndB with AHSA1/START domain